MKLAQWHKGSLFAALCLSLLNCQFLPQHKTVPTGSSVPRTVFKGAFQRRRLQDKGGDSAELVACSHIP